MGNDFKDLFGDWRPDDERRTPPDGVPAEPENFGRRPLNEKEVNVVGVYEEHSDSGLGFPLEKTFVLLRDNRDREFRIWIARDLAVAISMALDNEAPDRPFTHDLIKTLLERLGGTIERVTIDDIWQDTFYAKITLAYSGQTVDVDARPSDSIALALRFKAPIYVAESVLEMVSARQEN